MPAWKEEFLDAPCGTVWLRRAGAVVLLMFALALGRAPSADARDPRGTAARMQLEFHVSPAGSDSADGSAAHPWRTIQNAADRVVPGAVVHVAPGRYESGTIDARVSGAPAARIRFLSDSTWGARIHVGPATLYHYAWRQAGAFTDLEGFDISGDGFVGINIKGDDVRVLRNRVHDIPNRGSRGGAGILNEDGRHALIAGNVVHHIGDPDRPNALVHGIYLSRGSSGAIVQNNLVYRNQGAGIHTYHTAQAATISSNTVFANGNWGILIGGSNGSRIDHCLISNNIVYDNGGAAIVENGTTGSHNRFLNNLVFGNARGYELKTSPAALGTVSANPGFVDYRRDGSGNYRLAPGSPCIDAGTAAGAPATDFDGRHRPLGRGYDLGAFESRPSP